MTEAAKAATSIPNATTLEEDNRAASAQLRKMMLMICKGALNIVFLAGDSEGLEAWRHLTDKYEPKMMRTRFAGQLMSILSFSHQGDTTEIKSQPEPPPNGTVARSWTMKSRLERFCSYHPESQLKTHLLMLVDTLISEAKLLRSLKQSPRFRHGRWSHEQRNTEQGRQGVKMW